LSGGEEFFTPRLAVALGALVDDAANTEAVIALVAGSAGRKLSAFGTRLEELPLRSPVIVE